MNHRWATSHLRCGPPIRVRALVPPGAALCHCGRLLELIASSVLRGTGAYAQVRTVCWLRRGTQGRGIVATSDSFPRRGALGGNYLYFLVRL